MTTSSSSSSSSSKTTKIKRYRDAPSPKPILDRTSLLHDLKTNGIYLKNTEQTLDLFYQLLHRRGYPPLHEFVSELCGDINTSGLLVDDVSSIASSSSTPTTNTNFTSKNAISSKPNKLPQLPQIFTSYLRNNISNYETITSKIQSSHTSSNSTTTKLVIQLQDSHVVETVLMKHENRVTICLSSQVGCAMGCTFCATGTMGIRGNLSSGEILEQLVHGSRVLQRLDDDESLDTIAKEEVNNETRKKKTKQQHKEIRNVVFMGMGEPLNNYKNVLSACQAMIHRKLWNLAYNHVTVSTVGVPSRMRDLTNDIPEINLALSLHAPNQRMREEIVPSARGTPIESLIDALDGHMMALVRKKRVSGGNPQGCSDTNSSTTTDTNTTTDEFNIQERQSASKKKRAMIEYVMLTGDTSTIEAAHQLGQLCRGKHLVVNLIPYNKTNVKDKLSCPSEEHMQEFRSIVSSYGSFCTIRRTMGADIAGACGQLVVEEEEQKKKRRGSSGEVVDIEDYGTLVGQKKVEGKQQKRMTATGSKRHRSSSDIIDKKENDDPLVWRLKVATAIAASCLVVSTTLLLLQKRKR